MGRRQLRAPATRSGVVEEFAQDGGVVTREHDVLAQPLAPFRSLAVHEARDVEIERLFLAAAAVGDEE